MNIIEKWICTYMYVQYVYQLTIELVGSAKLGNVMILARLRSLHNWSELVKVHGDIHTYTYVRTRYIV